MDDSGRITLDNAGTLAAFEQAAGWVGAISPPGVVDFTEGDSLSIWLAGNAAFLRYWSSGYSASSAADSAIAGQFGVAMLPQGTGDGARHAATLGGWQLAVSRYSRDVASATQVATCLAGTEAQKLRALQSSYLPTIAALYEDEEVVAANPFFASLYDVFVESSVARPSTAIGRYYSEVSAAYYSQINAMLAGEISAETAIVNVERGLQATLP